MLYHIGELGDRLGIYDHRGPWHSSGAARGLTPFADTNRAQNYDEYKYLFDIRTNI